MKGYNFVANFLNNTKMKNMIQESKLNKAMKFIADFDKAAYYIIKIFDIEP